MAFLDIINDLGLPIAPEGHRHARPGWLQIDCPWCGKNSQVFHLGYSLTGNYANCWKCGPKRVVDIVMELSGLRYPEARKLLGDFTPELQQIKRTGHLQLPKGIRKMAGPHRHYLKYKRGLNPERMERIWGLRGICFDIRLPWRIFIPIHLGGNVVSWTTRAASDYTMRRYISADLEEEDVHHKDLLYGEDYARHAIIICEGPGDVWNIGPGAVATFGTSYTRSQIDRMSRYPTRVVCFDSDKAGQKRAKELVSILSVFDGDTYNAVLDAKDPGSASKAEIAELRSRFLERNCDDE
jgi:5S rRNA maturation endonuclease (ribonuclease M5)